MFLLLKATKKEIKSAIKIIELSTKVTEGVGWAGEGLFVIKLLT